MLSKKAKKRLTALVKIGVSALLLFYVFKKIDAEKLFTILGGSDRWWLFAAFLFFNISQGLSSLRLNLLFRDSGVEISNRANLRLYYVGMYYNLFLPGGVGGDGYKIYLLGRRFGVGVGALIKANLADRLSGLAALVFLAAALFNFSTFAGLHPLLPALAVLLLVSVYPLYLLAHRRLFKGLCSYITRISWLAFAVQSAQLLCALSIVYALPGRVGLVDFLSLFLVSSVVAVLPLTIGGVGARELTFLYGLGLIGQNPAVGVAFSFIFFMMNMLSSALGLFFVHRPLSGE